MGVLDDHVQKALQHVIQLGPTGLRQDLLRWYAAEFYLHRNPSITYRHAYDVVIPSFTPTELQVVKNGNDWYEKKTQWFFFAGALNHNLSSRSARPLLNTFGRNRSSMWTIEQKVFSVLKIGNGYMPPEDYVNTIFFSVFALCPKGTFHGVRASMKRSFLERFLYYWLTVSCCHSNGSFLGDHSR